jgi:sulfite reductase (NADPH) flavoprotein alpha-component
MDVAFSRDQAEKRYIQHVMRERMNDLYAWLEEGAHLYLCGDAEKLAPDVHDALLTTVETAGVMNHDEAEEYLKDLQRDGRYQRDVY